MLKGCSSAHAGDCGIGPGRADIPFMASTIKPILKLEVPVIVVLGRREIKVGDVVALGPGSIVELPKKADEELELMINNKVIGTGNAVKVGENFGVQINYIGDLKHRIAAMAAKPPAEPKPKDEAELLAEQMLAGQ